MYASIYRRLWPPISVALVGTILTLALAPTTTAALQVICAVSLMTGMVAEMSFQLYLLPVSIESRHRINLLSRAGRRAVMFVVCCGWILGFLGLSYLASAMPIGVPPWAWAAGLMALGVVYAMAFSTLLPGAPPLRRFEKLPPHTTSQNADEQNRA